MKTVTAPPLAAPSVRRRDGSLRITSVAADDRTIDLVAHDPRQLKRLYAAATRLALAETVEDASRRIADAALSLSRADRSTVTIAAAEGAHAGTFSSGSHLEPIGATLERELRLNGHSFGRLTVVTSRRRFPPVDEALFDLFCVHAALALENVGLRARERRLEQALARVRGVLGELGLVPATNSTVRQAGRLRLDLDRHQAFVGDVPIRLTSSEYRLLALLMEEPGRVYTRCEIVTRLWEGDTAVSLRVADRHVAALRAKIEKDPSHPELLQTVRSIGYKLAEA